MKKTAIILVLTLILGAGMFLTITLKISTGDDSPKKPNLQIFMTPEEPSKAPEKEPAENATEAPDVNILDVLFPTYPHETQDAPEPEVTEAPKPTNAPEPTQAPEPTKAPEPQKTYTSAQLNALANVLITYGPGRAENGDAPPYAADAQMLYGQYAAHFLEDTEGVIYLTFNCAYEHFLVDQPVTGLILDTLKEKDVKAMFFVTGSYVENYPDIVRRIIDEGHVLGNRSSTNQILPGKSIGEMEDQILTLHKTVQKEFGVTMKFFRPPEGAFSIRSLAVAQNLGYETVHWTFTYNDWDVNSQPDPDAALKKILSSHHDGAIYLLHALSTTNAEILDDVIDGLRDLGYRLDILS